jgi:hypothetical protein
MMLFHTSEEDVAEDGVMEGILLLCIGGMQTVIKFSVKSETTHVQCHKNLCTAIVS